MNLRRDPLPAGAELALVVEAGAAQNSSPHAVATVGKFEVHPGASNSIPSRVQITIDVRDGDMAVRDDLLMTFRTASADIARRRGLQHEFTILNSDPSLCCATEVVEAVASAASVLHLPYLPMISRAYHDTVFMSRLCPAGMIFIPCRHGYSHRPDEFTTPEAIDRGVSVLALTLAALADDA
jgi:N-carbamoyl-L-amino-acid hydrolase